MLVGYSSSSEEEDREAGDEAAATQNKSVCRKYQEEDDGKNGCPARKKPKIEEPATKPRCLWVGMCGGFVWLVGMLAESLNHALSNVPLLIL